MSALNGNMSIGTHFCTCARCVFASALFDVGFILCFCSRAIQKHDLSSMKLASRWSQNQAQDRAVSSWQTLAKALAVAAPSTGGDPLGWVLRYGRYTVTQIEVVISGKKPLCSLQAKLGRSFLLEHTKGPIPADPS